MKNLLLIMSLATLVFACSSTPSFKDKVNENAYQRIEMGQTYDQVLITMGGLEGRELTTGLYKWEDDRSNTTFSMTVSIKDGKVVAKTASTMDENGKVIKQVRFPE